MDLADTLGLERIGPDIMIASVAPYNQAAANDLTFTKLASSLVPGSIVITGDPAAHALPDPHISLLISDDPRLDFIRALEYLEATIGFVKPDFESRIHPSVKAGQGVVIEKGCDIEQGVILCHNVVVHAGSKIGKNTVIRPGAVIGGEGFGFSRLADGTPLRFVHLGGVSIGQNVEIGENTSICRGTLEDTIIEDNVKIDNLVHLAHNCHIKQGAFIIACAEVSGSVTVGENAWVGPNACILEKVNIGDSALIGIGSVVTKDVASHSVVAGNPAKFLRDIQ